MGERVLRLLLLSLGAFLVAGATPADTPSAWSQPTAPFRIVGAVHYVGTEGIAAYLIGTDDGLILLDGGLEESADLVKRSIAKLGFDPREVKLIVATHAHYDHAAALAELKRETGAQFASSPGDRAAYESGLPPSEVSYGIVRFPPVSVDRELVDGQPVELGGVTLTPLVTPGHTPGCTSWTMRVSSRVKRLTSSFRAA